jgi:hypothetical protein
MESLDEPELEVNNDGEKNDKEEYYFFVEKNDYQSSQHEHLRSWTHQNLKFEYHIEY